MILITHTHTHTHFKSLITVTFNFKIDIIYSCISYQLVFILLFQLVKYCTTRYLYPKLELFPEGKKLMEFQETSAFCYCKNISQMADSFSSHQLYSPSQKIERKTEKCITITESPN